MRVSSIEEVTIRTVWDQEIRKKTSSKASLTSEVMERQEENKPLNLTKGYTNVMLNKAIP